MLSVEALTPKTPNTNCNIFLEDLVQHDGLPQNMTIFVKSRAPFRMCCCTAWWFLRHYTLYFGAQLLITICPCRAWWSSITCGCKSFITTWTSPIALVNQTRHSANAGKLSAKTALMPWLGVQMLQYLLLDCFSWQCSWQTRVWDKPRVKVISSAPHLSWGPQVHLYAWKSLLQ